MENVAHFSKGKGYAKKDLVENNGIPIILYGRLYTDFETVIETVDTYVKNVSDAIISEGNEIIVPASGESAEEIARASVVANSGIILGGDLNIIKLKKDIVPTFLALLISNGKSKKTLKKLAQGNSVVHLYNSSLKTLKIGFPVIEEQEKIASLIMNLEKATELHQRKCDALVRLKEAYLQDMFPLNSESVPKVRFANYSGVWEQRKLGEIGDFIRTSVNPQSTPDNEFIEYSMPSFDNGRSPKVVLGKKMKSIRLKISGNVLLINKLNIRQKRIWLIQNAHINAVASSEFMPYTSKKINLEFLEQLMLTNATTRKLECLSSGTSNSQKRITPYDLLKHQISTPKSKKEQIKISSLFKQLDEIIALLQKKSEFLQELKKAYLQKMFI